MDTDKQTPSLPRWAPALLAALGECGVLSHACKQAGVDRRKVYDHRQTNPDLAARIEAARIRGGRVARAKKAEAAERKRGWQTEFLNALAETSNVLASAARAGVSHRKVYDTRRRSSTFAAKWQSALYEGYCNLEMEILGHLRDPRRGRNWMWPMPCACSPPTGRVPSAKWCSATMSAWPKSAPPSPARWRCCASRSPKMI